MADIEKVIKGIECCICQGKTRGPCSPECPYEAIEPDCWIVMNEDVLELLKEQQPRVLEYEELFKEETFSLWYEDKEHLLLLHVACVDGEYEDMHVNVAVEDSHENWSTYGKTWRMWNAIPTEEQRKAEPWKAGEQE